MIIILIIKIVHVCHNFNFYKNIFKLFILSYTCTILSKHFLNSKSIIHNLLSNNQNFYLVLYQTQ